MITCPECGWEAADDARFCEHCGRGLQDVPQRSSLEPLSPGYELAGRFTVAELLSQNFNENRYRATALSDPQASFILRERSAPPPPVVLAEEVEPEQSSSAPEESADEEDPAGPRAPTRDLAPEAPPQGPQSEPLSPAPEEAAEDGEAATEEPGEQLYGPVAEAEEMAMRSDLGEVFERVLALSHILTHPAFLRPQEGFVAGERAYLVYSDEALKPFAQKADKLSDPSVLAIGIQLCQALGFLHKHGLRLNDLCPASLAWAADRRLKITGLDYVSNDDELQAEPILNDGYTAPEIYRGKHVDKRADLFSLGCVLYACLTGERIECESWREEAGPIRFYPPHAVSPDLEETVRRALAFRPADRYPSADAFKERLLALAGQVEVRAGALTHVGMVREHNEDSILTLEYMRDSQVDPDRRFLYVVSDGMGGAAAGETASAIAVATIRDYLEREPSRTDGRPRAELVQAALEEANNRIIEYQAANPEVRGMGATAVTALLTPPEAAIAWVGDSRAYLWEPNRGLRQLTKDHSLVQRLVEIGQISPEEARHHEHKNVITRSLGARASGPAGAEALSLRLKRGDRLLLCSDGLTAHVDDGQIAEIFDREPDPQAASTELVVAANAGGGTDNISVIVIDAR